MGRWCALVAAFVVACNSSTPHLGIDGNAGDATSADAAAAADAAIDGSPLAPITVTVYDEVVTSPVANAKVEFVGTTTQTVMTDGSGVASAVSSPNTTVVVYQTGELGTPLVKSFAGVNPGDSIDSGGWPVQAFPVLGTVTLAPPTVAGAMTYYGSVSCSVGTPVGLAFEVVHCPFATNATAVAWAVDASGNLLSGPSVITNLDLTAAAGTTVTMPAFAASPTTITSEITNVPAGSSPIDWYETDYNGSDTSALTYAGSQPPAAQMQMVSVGTRSVSTLEYQPPGYDFVYYDHADNALVTDFQVDASTAIVSITNESYDAASNSIVWTESPAGAKPTILNVFVTIASGSGVKANLQLHAPYGSSVPLPALPSTMAPAAGDQIDVNASFQLYDSMTYEQVLQVVDTHPGFNPVGDPAFVGGLWQD